MRFPTANARVVPLSCQTARRLAWVRLPTIRRAWLERPLPMAIRSTPSRLPLGQRRSGDYYKPTRGYISFSSVRPAVLDPAHKFLVRRAKLGWIFVGASLGHQPLVEL